MSANNIIKSISEEVKDKLYDSLEVCAYCKTPFKECDTIIPGKGIVVGEVDVVKYKNLFWHHGCIADYKKDKHL
ncbi:MAG: hypothetical protein MUC39_04015 [Candidatus Omnitrophica bacterium]|jgi:hypothetical protein|nr:hypothetical protein [Candidatus Omnitrophota bacterium]